MSLFAKLKSSSELTISIAAHVLLLMIFGFNLLRMPFKQEQVVQIPIQATVIDTSVIREKREAQQREQAELARKKKAEADRKKKEQQRLAEQKRKKDAEAKQRAEQKRKKEAEAKKLAEQKRKAEAKQLAEQKRKKEAETKKLAEQKRKAEAKRLAEEKKKAEAAKIAEQKRKAEEAARIAEEKQRAEALRREQEMQAQLDRELAAEASRLAAISAGKLQQYVAAIANRVERNWVRPASARPGIACEVLVSQIPGGEIVNVRVVQCNGDAAVVRSIEAAVYRSSPLPPPPDPSLFERNLRFTFKPQE